MCMDNEMNLGGFKWKRIVIAVTVCMAIIIPLDAKQQKQYATVRTAYMQMEMYNYEVAYDMFESYINCHSSIYWNLERIVNGKDSDFGYENIERSMDICLTAINKDRRSND